MAVWHVRKVNFFVGMFVPGGFQTKLNASDSPDIRWLQVNLSLCLGAQRSTEQGQNHFLALLLIILVKISSNPVQNQSYIPFQFWVFEEMFHIPFQVRFPVTLKGERKRTWWTLEMAAFQERLAQRHAAFKRGRAGPLHGPWSSIDWEQMCRNDVCWWFSMTYREKNLQTMDGLL